MTLEQKIERHLSNLICEGGGDGETLSDYAKRIMRTIRSHPKGRA